MPDKLWRYTELHYDLGEEAQVVIFHRTATGQANCLVSEKDSEKESMFGKCLGRVLILLRLNHD